MIWTPDRQRHALENPDRQRHAPLLRCMLPASSARVTHDLKLFPAMTVSMYLRLNNPKMKWDAETRAKQLEKFKEACAMLTRDCGEHPVFRVFAV